MIDSHNPSFQLNSEMIYRKMGDQRLLVPIGPTIDSVRSIYTLNETAAQIYDGLKAKQTLQQIVEGLMSEYAFENADEARKAVDDLIVEFKKHQVIL